VTTKTWAAWQLARRDRDRVPRLAPTLAGRAALPALRWLGSRAPAQQTLEPGVHSAQRTHFILPFASGS
jgi:hypothetical protein